MTWDGQLAAATRACAHVWRDAKGAKGRVAAAARRAGINGEKEAMHGAREFNHFVRLWAETLVNERGVVDGLGNLNRHSIHDFALGAIAKACTKRCSHSRMRDKTYILAAQ